MNKLIYKIIRKILIETTPKDHARKVYFGPLKGKKWIYSSGFSEYFMGNYEKEVVDIFYEYAKKSKVIYDWEQTLATILFWPQMQQRT